MMTSIFGSIEIQQITGGTVHFGYTHCISPKNAVKDPSGGGSKNQGAWVYTTTGISIVNYYDPDVSDQQLDTQETEEETVINEP
ncbi:spore germination protein [Bacillus marasmi]|uniref:spore germination protein n=1 Tax=Bacillus marasmi TaxID=1926279 RepID=UPI001C9CC8AD|nr:spore germination protein [Bacillus marasmi]